MSHLAYQQQNCQLKENIILCYVIKSKPIMNKTFNDHMPYKLFAIFHIKLVIPVLSKFPLIHNLKPKSEMKNSKFPNMHNYGCTLD